jgi:hypothetical protein
VSRAVTLLALAASFAATASAAAAPPVPIGGSPVGEDSLSASLSSMKANAKPVELTLKLHAELMCDQPGSPLIVALPADASVPTKLAPAAVLVDGKPSAAVAVTAHRVTITTTHVGGLLCHVVAPGLVTLRFTKSARLGNPATPGTYTISVQRGRSTYRTPIHISA